MPRGVPSVQHFRRGSSVSRAAKFFFFCSSAAGRYGMTLPSTMPATGRRVLARPNAARGRSRRRSWSARCRRSPACRWPAAESSRLRPDGWRQHERRRQQYEPAATAGGCDHIPRASRLLRLRSEPSRASRRVLRAAGLEGAAVGQRHDDRVAKRSAVLRAVALDRESSSPGLTSALVRPIRPSDWARRTRRPSWSPCRPRP